MQFLAAIPTGKIICRVIPSAIIILSCYKQYNYRIKEQGRLSDGMLQAQCSMLDK